MSALPPEFGLKVVFDTMDPVYRLGDTVICVPCQSTKTGNDYVIAAKPGGRLRPGVEVIRPIMRLVCVDRVTATHLYARQYNPAKVRRLSRAKWQVAAKVAAVWRAGHGTEVAA